MELEFKLQAFEGPMDLLLHLIDKNKVSIYDIPIAEITEQFLEYVRGMEEEQLDAASDFLVMAATLLDIKARMLLPASEEDEEEGDPREELVRRLIEYKRYKLLGEDLEDMSAGSELRFYRDERLPEEVLRYKAPVDLDSLLGDVDSEKLRAVFEDVMRRRADKEDTTRPDISKMKREVVPISSRITYVKERVKKGGRLSFRKLLEGGATKVEIIVTFLAILELMKTGEIRLTKDSTAEDFTVEEAENGQLSGEN